MITLHDSVLRAHQRYPGSGNTVLDPHLASAEIHEEINGAFTLTLSWPINQVEMPRQGDIIAAPVPGMERQGFRIHTIDIDREGMVSATCTHITSDLAVNVVVDKAAVNRTASEALSYLLSSLSASHPFTAGPASNLGPRHTIRWVRKTGLEALFNETHGIVGRFGGEIIRDNTHVTWVAKRGAGRGVSVWEGKNLINLDITLDTTSLVTRILPVGFDGLTLPEVFVDSPALSYYSHPYIRVVRFDSIKAGKDSENLRDGELTYDDALNALRQASHALFRDEAVDEPTLVIQAQMAPDQIGIEQVRIGDMLNVHAPSWHVDATARIIGYTFNALTGTYTSLTLATHPEAANVRSLSGQITSTIRREENNAREYTAALISANETARVYYQTQQPQSGRVGDTWFQDAGEGKIAIWVYQNTSTGEPGWVQVAGDITAAAIQSELEATKAQISRISTDLDERMSTLDTAFKTQVESVRQEIKTGEEEAKAQTDELSSRIDEAIKAARAEFNVKTSELYDGIEGVAQYTNATSRDLESKIETKADTDRIIEAINTSREPDIILGRRLEVTRETSIAANVIKTAMIANAAITSAKIMSVDAGKITTGYLNAARIKAGSITSDKLVIANGFITSAMIKEASIANAHIASLDAGKITTGYLDAARIKAGSITSDKLVIANGFITSAMIKDAAITNAKIGALDAGKITTGVLNAARIGAGSITSDKLTIADGFIKTAMIADAAITSAKIGTLDAGKITTGTLNTARIGARSITADKLATNAIQVGLAGWSSTIRISPTSISWYNGATLEGRITEKGMTFWYGSRKIGWIGEQYKKDHPDIRGITNALEATGDFVDWAYEKDTSATVYTSVLSLDPRGKFWGQTGIHFNMAVRTHGWEFYTAGNRAISLQDTTLTGIGTYPSWATSTNKSKIVFHTSNLFIVTNNTYYNMTSVMSRLKDLMSRVNTLITMLNHGWISTITDTGGGNISWKYYDNTGLQPMSTTLS